MSDYKAEQDWLMSQIEVQQRQFERRELTEVVESIDRELRSRIVGYMRTMNNALTEVSEKECFDRWKAAHMAQKTGSVKVLEKAKWLRDSSDLDL